MAGGEFQLITTGGSYLESEPSWSPASRTIVFVRTGGTASGDLWVVDVNSGVQRQLIAQDPADGQRSPAWSPDGQWIAFTSKHELSADFTWRYQVYTVRADGSQLTR